jgi:hypothetical protein
MNNYIGGSMNINKALPALYFFSGMAITFHVDSAFGYFTGNLLMLLACIIWFRRAESRQPHLSGETQNILDQPRSNIGGISHF